MNKRIFPGAALLALSLVFPIAARGEDPSAEIRLLREQLAQQAAELERVRAALQRIETTVVPPPQTSSSTTSAPAPAAPIRFSGLLQGWAMTGDASFQDTFRIRRTELKLSGDLAKNVGWTLMIDASKSLSHATVDGQTTINQAGRPLQDAFVTIGNPRRVLLTAGQFKLPLSREGLESSATLDVIERALFMTDRSRGGSYGDVRDVGVSLRRTVPDRYELLLGVYNGTGESQNDVDRNERKSVVARVAVPVLPIEGLRVGTSAAWGGGRGGDRRDRYGADLLFARGGWKLKTEVMAGRDGAIEREGFYAHVGRELSPRLELIARFDQWDPDTSSDHDLATSLERDYILGGNVKLDSSLRLQANVIHKTYASEAVPTRNLLLINLQTSW